MGEWDDELDRVRTDWERLRNDEAESIRGWSNSLDEVRLEFQRLVAHNQWLDGRSDLLWATGLHRRETVHSAVLAWLWTPTRRHGLADRFLEKLLNRCGIGASPSTIAGARAECEVSRQDTRADIVIWAPMFTIVIENKIDAAEQPNQCARLVAQFEHEIYPRFVFLTPTGRDPSTAVESFLTLSYHDLRSRICGRLRGELGSS